MWVQWRRANGVVMWCEVSGPMWCEVSGPVGFGTGGARNLFSHGISCDVMCLHAKSHLDYPNAPKAIFLDRSVCIHTEGSWLLRVTVNCLTGMLVLKTTCDADSMQACGKPRTLRESKAWLWYVVVIAIDSAARHVVSEHRQIAVPKTSLLQSRTCLGPT